MTRAERRIIVNAQKVAADYYKDAREWYDDYVAMPEHRNYIYSQYRQHIIGAAYYSRIARMYAGIE